MNLVAIKIQALRKWAKIQNKQIDNYLINYPSVKSQTLDVMAAFKNRLSNIIQHITDELAYQRGGKNQQSFPSQINLMYRVKVQLEQIRFSCLGLQDKKYKKSIQIIIKLNDLVSLLELKVNNSFQNNELKTYSLPKEKSNTLKQLNLMQRYNEVLKSKETEQEKTMRVKKELYIQMNNHLKYRKNQITRRVEKNEILDKQNIAQIRIHHQSYKNKYLQSDKQIDENRQKQQHFNKNRKIKRFNYLQTFQREAAKQKYQLFSTNNQKQFSSPSQKQKYESLPSTQHQSDQKIIDYDTLGDQIQFFNETFGSPQGKVLNFESFIKEMHQSEEQNWQKFQQSKNESSQKSNDDSLQLMKKSNLNETGKFKTDKLMQQIQHLQFSFRDE